MNKTKLKYVKYTKQELDRYVRDKGSCINLVNSEMHIGFPPWGFATFQETLTNIISREKIGKFDPKMNGIVLDVRNIKVFGTSYPVHDDDPINHINLKANFYIFQPRIGATIKGIVKHISHGHVAVIIYRVFNVSIRFNRAQRTQQHLCVNDSISFRIKKFDLQDAMPYIEGELIAEVYQSKTKPQIHKIFDQNDGEVDNGADSGISTEETFGKKADNVVSKKTAHSSSESGSDSEDDNDSSSSSSSSSDSDEKPSKNILLENIKIKQEKFSDSEEEAKHKNALKRKKREENSSSESESSDDATDDSGEPQLRNVKKEKITSESSSRSSDSDSNSSSSDDSGSENGDVVANRIKKEKDEDSSFAVPSHPILLRPIKSEPMSDVEGRTPEKPLSNACKKKVSGKRTLSITEHLDSFLADAMNETSGIFNENGSKMKKRKKLDETNLTDLTAKFRSPAMSSTLKPNAKIPKSTPTKVKEEIQSEDERPKKKKNKPSTKQSLDNMESELFKNFAG